MRRLPMLLAAAALGVGGCAEPVLDPGDVDGSLAELRDELDPERRPAFDAAAALVRQASAGEIAGTERFELGGLTAAGILAEAERIDIRRERALEAESAAAQRELLAAAEQLERLRVLQFVPQPVGDTRMEADLTVRNDLGFAVDTAWLRVEVALPGGPAHGGEEFLAFRPALQPGEQRFVRMLLSEDEARSLPAEPPAQVHYRFVMAEGGGFGTLQAPDPEQRQRAERQLAESERRIAALDARLAAVRLPEL